MAIQVSPATYQYHCASISHRITNFSTAKIQQLNICELQTTTFDCTSWYSLTA